MAAPISSGYLGDATGGIGQGLAFVLPESKSGAYAMQLAQTHGDQLREMAQQKVLAQQKAELQYEQDFKNQELPKIYAPFDNVVRKRQDEWLNKAAAYHAETGKSPFTNTDMLADHNDNILGLAAKSTQFGEDIKKANAAIQADKDGKYSDESKNQWKDWYDNFQGASDSDKIDYLEHPDKHQMPQLKDRDYTIIDAAKTMHPTPKEDSVGDYNVIGPDRKNHETQAYTIFGDPRYNNLQKKYRINPDGPDSSAYVYQQDAMGNDIPSTGHRVFPTDHHYGEYMANEWLHDPNKIKTLQKIGVNQDDPYAVQKLAHYITDTNDAKGKLVNDIATELDSKVEPKNIYTGKATSERDRQQSERYRRESLHISQQHLDDSEKWHNEKEGVEKVSDAIYNFNTNPTLAHKSLDAISKLYEVNGSYNKPLQGVKIDGNRLQFTIPPKLKENPQYSPAIKESKYNQKYIEIQPAIPVSVNLTDKEQVRAVINGALKNVGGESNYNKFVGKGAGSKDAETPKPGSKTISPQKLKSLVGKPGYEGYSEQEIIDYYKKNGYNVK